MSNQDLALQKIIAFFDSHNSNNTYQENKLSQEIKIDDCVSLSEN